MDEFVVKKAILEFKDTFTVYKNNKVIFIATNKSVKDVFNNNYTITDRQKKVHITIENELTRKEVHYHLKKDGETFATIRTNLGLSTKGFWIQSHKITTTDRNNKLVYTVYQNEEEIGEIKTKLFRLREVYQVKIQASSLEYLYIFIGLVIAINDQSPSLAGGLFSRLLH